MCIEDIRELFKEAEVAFSEEQLKFVYENLENLVVTGSPSSYSRQTPYEKECKELRQEVDDMVSYLVQMSKHKDCCYCGGRGIVDDFYVRRCPEFDGYGVRRKI